MWSISAMVLAKKELARWVLFRLAGAFICGPLHRLLLTTGSGERTATGNFSGNHQCFQRGEFQFWRWLCRPEKGHTGGFKRLYSGYIVAICVSQVTVGGPLKPKTWSIDVNCRSFGKASQFGHAYRGSFFCSYFSKSMFQTDQQWWDIRLVLQNI